MMPIGGCTRVTQSPLSSKIRGLFQWRDSSAREWTAIGTETGISILFGVMTDVTPAGFVSMQGIAGGGFGTLEYGQDDAPTADTPGTVLKFSSVTISQASPAIVTWNNHGLLGNSAVTFTTTGTLPAPLAINTLYYVTGVTTNTFQIQPAEENVPINTTTAGSGTHTANAVLVNYGQDTYGRQRNYNPPIFRKPDHWSFATFGQDLMSVCSSDGRLMHLAANANATPVIDIPSNAPTGNFAVAVTAERAVMLMGAGGNPRRVAWSDFENYNGWTFNTTTGQAGYIDLEATSPIITGVRVKEGVLVLTQHEAFLLRYVGAPYFYGAEKLGTTTFSAPNAIASGGSSTVWFGQSGFWRYDGGAIRQIQCPMFGDIKNNFDPTYGNYRAHMHESGVFPEFWFEYPDFHSSDGECNNYVIWNYAENIWIRGSRARTAAVGAITAAYPIAAAKDNHVYQQEDGWLEAGESRIGQVWAETSVLDFGQGDNYVDINQALVSTDPDSVQTNYQIKLLSRYAPTQTETVFGPYTPRIDGYTDTRATGRDLRLRVEATSDNYWSIGQIRLDIVSNGGRR
ncbi:MAG: hypothetical protein ACR2IL_10740 [Chitinophagaceae bacterium]